MSIDFEAANYVIDHVEGIYNPENALNRFEFIEILIRLAKDKYITFGKKTESIAVAFEMLI